MPTAIRLSPRRSFTERAKSVWRKLKAGVGAATRRVLNAVNPAGRTARIRAQNKASRRARSATANARWRQTQETLRNNAAAVRGAPFRVMANSARTALRSAAASARTAWNTSVLGRGRSSTV